MTTDGYSVYTSLPDVINTGCWVNARRKFDEVIKASGGKQKNPKALEGLEFVTKLYNIERDLKEQESESRYEERLLRSKPVLEAFLV